jgi:hypothetical protein
VEEVVVEEAAAEGEAAAAVVGLVAVADIPEVVPGDTATASPCTGR